MYTEIKRNVFTHEIHYVNLLSPRAAIKQKYVIYLMLKYSPTPALEAETTQ